MNYLYIGFLSKVAIFKNRKIDNMFKLFNTFIVFYIIPCVVRT